ncbi:MAG: SDR family oxidoreductase [Ardenticatenaceae bacterium]|nr:SDR family oxidoreductase [Ardenticatenaceae bacterium]MCB9003343.1 SDR family oxidoreductase [Ardenticatenaceae bacterium]
MNPKGKTALITGGAVRVGKAITLALAQAGANVVINYHSSAGAAEETAVAAQSFGVKALAIQADIGNAEQVKAMVATAQAEFGSVDILVNNASLWQQTPFPTDDLDNWRRVTDILINGSFYCANAVAPLMLAQGEGAIVNIIDLSVYEPWPNYTAHAMGKGALLALNRQLALELAPAVRVNAVAPGPVLAPADYDAEKIARTAAKTLLNRWGTAEDVAEAVLFFVKASYVTGELLAVDGGQRFGHRKHEHG